MAKKRKYGDAWKDVQIDAEQNDAVFDRFFKRAPIQPDNLNKSELGAGNLFPDPGRAPQKIIPPDSEHRKGKQPQGKATVKQITPKASNIPSTASDISAQVETIKQQYRLSKGEAAILKHMLKLARESGVPECYAKIPQLADLCEMTHRGCQFALKNLQARGFVTKVKDYDPSDRLGIKFQISVPSL
jgi:hypothetical protein